MSSALSFGMEPVAKRNTVNCDSWNRSLSVLKLIDVFGRNHLNWLDEREHGG
jgi:hypothetical protein